MAFVHAAVKFDLKSKSELELLTRSRCSYCASLVMYSKNGCKNCGAPMNRPTLRPLNGKSEQEPGKIWILD